MKNNFPNKLLTCLFPRRCLLCNKRSGSTIDLCQACRKSLPQATGPTCKHCATPLEKEKTIAIDKTDKTTSATVSELVCGQCQQYPPLAVKTIACFYYKPPITTLILSLKFKEQLPNARLLGTLMAERLSEYYEDQPKPDIIIPMPLHRKRLCERGFNQATELAKPISHAFKIPIAYSAVKRKRYTVNQTSLPAKQRRANVRDAFMLTGPLNANRVVIIDDVITTGSTTRALCETLLQSGNISEIHIWCCARA